MRGGGLREILSKDMGWLTRGRPLTPASTVYGCIKHHFIKDSSILSDNDLGGGEGRILTPTVRTVFALCKPPAWGGLADMCAKMVGGGSTIIYRYKLYSFIFERGLLKGNSVKV